jgi:pantothenate kinase
MLALARFFTGIDDYTSLLNMAKKGDRLKVDSLFSDITEGEDYLQYSKDIPINFMAKISREKIEKGEITMEDVCQSCFAAVGREIDWLLCAYAPLYKFKEVYITGSVYQDNDFLMNMQGKNVIFEDRYPKCFYLDHGSYLGAIGSILT